MQPGLAKLAVIPTVWGHMGALPLVRSCVSWQLTTMIVAGGGANEADLEFIKHQVQEFLKDL